MKLIKPSLNKQETTIDPSPDIDECNLLTKTKQKEINENPSGQGKKENLRQRAYLNLITSLLDYGATLIAGFIANPFIINGLGNIFYGVWKMLGQLTHYTDLADIKAAQALKWAIAKNRYIATDDELRSYVTNAFVLITLILPVVLIAGGIISWYSPHITKIAPEYFNIVRLTCAILILQIIVIKVFNIFECILQGMNLGFKRMGIRAVIVLFGGGLQIAAVQLGYGLIGLSIAQVIVAIITGLTLYVIVKKYILWFGFGKTDFSKVLNFGKLSGWFMVFTGAKMALSSDLLILGIIAGPSLVTSYSITMFSANAIQGIVITAVHGMIPGIGGIVGEKKYKKAGIAREHLTIVTWLLGIALGALVILFNQSFIGLWIGDNLFAGHAVNILIVFLVLQNIFINNDGAIINVTLNIRMKVIFTLLAALISIIFALFLIKPYGILGLCISLFTGRLLLSIGFPYIIQKEFNNSLRLPINQIIRLILVSILIIGASYLIAKNIMIKNWIYLILVIPPTFLFAASACWFVGLTSDQKHGLKDIYKKIKLFRND